MKLHLIRHAKTNQLSSSGKDFDRALLPKGDAQLELLKYKISAKEEDIILSSSSKRTKQTAIALFPKQQIKFYDDLYLCSVRTFLEHIWSQQKSVDLWIVAHNFGISDLLNYFTDDDIEMRTGEYVSISFQINAWIEASRSTGTIVDRYRPEPSDY